MAGYKAPVQQGGGGIDLVDLNEFLRLALKEHKRRAEFEAMMPLFESDDCVTVMGSPNGRSVRIMLYVDGVSRYISLRTILSYMKNGTAFTSMPRATCKPGCIHPDHAVSTSPMLRAGRLVGRLVVHTSQPSA